MDVSPVVLEQLPSKKIARNPASNPNPNPSNCPDTLPSVLGVEI